MDEVAATKRFYHWPEDENFLVPDRVREHFAGAMAENGGRLRREWEELFARYAQEYPELAEQLNRMQRRTLPDGWDADLPEFPPDAKGIASRDSSGKVLNAVAGRVPWLIGGSSDLAPSNKSRLTFDGAGDFSRGRPGRAQPALRGARARRRGGLPTGSRCPSCAPTRPGSSSSPTSSAARCGSRR